MNRFNLFRGAIALAAVIAAHFGFVDAEALGFLVVGAQTATSDTDMQNAMKVLFEDSVETGYLKETEFIDIFDKESGGIQIDQTTGGRYIETAQLFDLPAGVGARAEGEAIPVPNGPTVVNGRVNLRKVQTTVEMTGDVFDVVRSSEGAFLNWADEAMPRIVDLLSIEMDRMAIGYGAGIVARVNDATPTATFAVDSAYGVAGYSKPWTLFQENESIVFSPNVDGSSPRDSGASAKITDVDPAGNLTVDSMPAGVADDDYIFKGDDNGFGSQTAGGENREFMGVLGAIDDGGILATFQNIDRTVYRKWQAYVDIKGSGATLTEDMLVETDDDAFEIGGAMPGVIVLSRKKSREYWADLKSDRAINDPRGSFEGGLNNKGLAVHLGDRVVTLRVSRKMPDELVFGIDPSTFKRFINKGFEWDSRTGSIWNRVTTSAGRFDAFYATGYARQELACKHPRKNWRLEFTA